MLMFAIDPGNVYSAYCIIDTETLRPLQFAKAENDVVRAELKRFISENSIWNKSFAIERMQSYGNAVGKTVLETCEWIGRYTELWRSAGKSEMEYVYRIEEKMHICKSPKAGDSNIRRALIDRFAERDLKFGRGTKSAPDWFYGFAADVWSAYAVGLTAIERGKDGK